MGKKKPDVPFLIFEVFSWFQSKKMDLIFNKVSLEQHGQDALHHDKVLCRLSISVIKKALKLWTEAAESVFLSHVVMKKVFPGKCQNTLEEAHFGRCQNQQPTKVRALNLDTKKVDLEMTSYRLTLQRCVLDSF